MRHFYCAIRQLFLTVLLLTSFVYIAQGQTPVAILENATGDTVLSSYSDGGLLVPGKLNTGTIPGEGQGVRMMWYPAKAGFRAGSVSADQWNEVNVGQYSTAFGQNTEASGSNSTALGSETEASGFFSTAFGYYTIASADYSTAFGFSTESPGQYSTAFGQNTEASGNYSTAFGSETEASGNNSTAFGTETVASGQLATAFGLSTVASGRLSTAFGDGTEASGEFSTAFGLGTDASGDLSTAFGIQTQATGDFSFATGQASVASGTNAISMGIYTQATGNLSTAIGQETVASGDLSTAFGYGTVAATDNSFSIGEWNMSNQMSDNTLFVIGNGQHYMNRSDAFRVEADGTVTAAVVNVTSDRRLKENIQPLDDHTLDKLAKIHPVHYTFKNQQTKPAGVQIGLIAQEVQAQFPELVSEGSDGYLSLSYSNFTAVLLKGMQEQQAQIQDLQKQLEEKNQQIQNLQAQVQRLDQFEARLAILENSKHNTTSNDAE